MQMDQLNKLSKGELLTLLSKKKISYYQLSSSERESILVVPAFGGRLLGAFFDSQNLLWVNKVSFEGWNKGGHRTWYAPEWTQKSIYILNGLESWQVPSQMDPGNYQVTEYWPDRLIAMKNDFNVETYDHTHYHLSFTRKITLETQEEYEDSFLILKNIPNLRYISLLFEHCLTNKTMVTIFEKIGLWSILAVIPPGDVIVPLAETTGQIYYDYYEPLSMERMKISKDCLSVFVDGEKRYKVGFPPDKTRGKIGYVPRIEEKYSYLILKSFPNLINGKYVDKPKDDLRSSGDVIQVYNHFEGKELAFAELESHAPAKVLLPGEEQCSSIKLLFLFGPKQSLDQAVAKLFGEVII